jgi:hypothetical protein
MRANGSTWIGAVIVCSLCLAPVCGWGEETKENVVLEEIVVTDKTEEQLYEKKRLQPNTERTMTQKGIKLLGGASQTNPLNVLQLLPSVNVQGADGFGLEKTQAVNIRGKSSYHLDRTVEGAPFTGGHAFGGSGDLIDLENMESIAMSRSNEYFHYFDTTINRVRRVWNVIPRTSRPKVLYFDPDTLTTPLAIADWWIEEAGGRSVTAGISRSENIRYSQEQVLLWNPDVMIVPAQEHVAAVYRDKRTSKTKAVLNKRVYAIPVGAHPWGHRTAEQPLTVLWAAKKFYPDRFKQVSMEDEVRTFYRCFFEYDLSDKDIRRILTGGAE